MSQPECTQCGADPTIWLSGDDPRCDDCPPEECARCGDSIDNSDIKDAWEWRVHCETCERIENLDVWCDDCKSQLVVETWDHDGVKITCDCSFAYVPHDGFSLNAPYSWKIEGRRGERHMRKR